MESKLAGGGDTAPVRKLQIERYDAYEKQTPFPTPADCAHHVTFGLGTQLLSAASQGDSDDVKELLAQGASPNTSNADGLTPLHQVCIDNRKDLLEMLLQAGASVDARDNEGWTPLHAAVSCGHVNVISILLKADADLLAVNVDEQVPLDVAREMHGVHSMVYKMLKDAMEKRGISDRNILSAKQAWINKFFELVKESTKSRRPPTNILANGATLLHFAACHDFIEAAQQLIEHGAVVDAVDDDGWTPLHAAVHWDQRSIAHFLVALGADVNRTTRNGETLRDLADENILGAQDLVDALIREAEDAKKRTTPLMLKTPSPAVGSDTSTPSLTSPPTSAPAAIPRVVHGAAVLVVPPVMQSVKPQTVDAVTEDSGSPFTPTLTPTLTPTPAAVISPPPVAATAPPPSAPQPQPLREASPAPASVAQPNTIHTNTAEQATAATSTASAETDTTTADTYPDTKPAAGAGKDEEPTILSRVQEAVRRFSHTRRNSAELDTLTTARRRSSIIRTGTVDKRSIAANDRKNEYRTFQSAATQDLTSPTENGSKTNIVASLAQALESRKPSAVAPGAPLTKDTPSTSSDPSEPKLRNGSQLNADAKTFTSTAAPTSSSTSNGASKLATGPQPLLRSQSSGASAKGSSSATASISSNNQPLSSSSSASSRMPPPDPKSFAAAVAKPSAAAATLGRSVSEQPTSSKSAAPPGGSNATNTSKPVSSASSAPAAPMLFVPTSPDRPASLEFVPPASPSETATLRNAASTSAASSPSQRLAHAKRARVNRRKTTYDIDPVSISALPLPQSPGEPVAANVPLEDRDAIMTTLQALERRLEEMDALWLAHRDHTRNTLDEIRRRLSSRETSSSSISDV